MTHFDNDSYKWATRFKSRDIQALEEAIDVFGPSILALVKRVLSGTGSVEDAEECVSDVFMAAWHGIERFEESRASFRTWLLLLAKYKSLDLRRRIMRRGETRALCDFEVGLTDNSTERDVLSRESTRELVIFIRGMGEPYYESLDDLALAFGLTKKAVESRLYRCRTALQQELHMTDNVRKEEPS